MFLLKIKCSIVRKKKWLNIFKIKQSLIFKLYIISI